ncbi:MAG TPA: alpha-(1-_3)-arabinofuranosyltransferase family protein [Ilumatobacteraceae bacterium]
MTLSTTTLSARIKRVRVGLEVGLLVALAYIPTLMASPGKLPTDTKLYLYLNPGRLTTDAAYSWDSRQFAGWVPHQTISYLWPSGPWYSFFSWLGAPDWVAQRLWIATLMVLGGLGVRWLAKMLGLAPTGALIAALFYQLSPYILPYVSRTSVMMLPWAGLGWLIGLTIRAATRTRWRDIGLIGLVMATVASTNATAILMIAPGPAIWLVHAAWARSITWRRALITAAKVAGISLATSLWWIAMLSIQGTFGADVLSYSETLQAVSLTSSSTETLRGMGYWLFYVRDPIGFTTSASYHYMASGKAIAISFAVLAIGVLGLACTKWASRRYAVLLVFIGIVLAVGVHPIDNPSPLMSGSADNSRSSLALALRSSTRALPLSTLGFALGAGALITALAAGRRRARRFDVRRAAPWLAGLLAILNLPVLWNGGFVDAALIRDENPPKAWTDAAAALDASPAGYRVFELPGQEFGAFRWGYTVDPPLPGLTTKPLVTRDLLPLGSPAAMDLLYALDDRFQSGTAELSEVAPVARLLGVDTIWLPNDAAFERFRTPRPEITAATFAIGDPGLGTPQTFGTPAVNTPAIPMVDEQSISDTAVGTPLAPVELVPVNDPEPVVRAKTNTVVVAGSGDGVVDAAAAGLIDGTDLIRYAADLPPSADGQDGASGDPIAAASDVIVTDSNRDRAHQWRGSQDVWGFTEDGGSGSGVLKFDSADQRTPEFPDETGADQTVSEQRGTVTAAVSSYGEPFAYRPEDRAAMAIDGNPATAWLVADRFDPDGEYIRLTSTTPVSTLTLEQPQDSRNRWITRIKVTDDSGSYDEDLTDSSRAAAGQAITLRRASTVVTITIEATDHTPVSPGQGLDAVGLAEIRTGAAPTEELIRVPSNVLPRVSAAQKLDIVLTRLRTSPTDRWRSDPEPTLARVFTLGTARTADATITTRVDQRASDSTLATLLNWTGTTANRRLTGVPAMGGWAATDGDPATSWVTPFAQAVGSALTIPLSGGAPISSLRVVQPPSSQYGVITAVTVGGAAGSQPVTVPAPDASGASTISFAPISGSTLTVTVTATNGATTIDRRYGEPTQLPVAISEVSGTGIVATPLPTTFDSGCRNDLLTIDNTPVAARVTGTVAALFADTDATTSLCDTAPLQLTAGAHIVRSTNGLETGLDVDRLLLRSAGTAAAATSVAVPTTTSAAAALAAQPAVTVLASSHTSRTVQVAACPTGCWFVFGEGYDTGWTATSAGKSLGKQQVVDGGFNGWYLPPSSTPRTIHLTFGPQKTLTIALVLSALAVLGCIALIVFDRRRRDAYPGDVPALLPFWGRAPSESPYRWRSPATISTAVAAGAGFLVIAPVWGVICGVVTFIAAFVLRRPRLLGLLSVAISLYMGLIVLVRVLHRHPFVNAGWPANFEDLHRLGMSVIVFLLAAAVALVPTDAVGARLTSEHPDEPQPAQPTAS